MGCYELMDGESNSLGAPEISFLFLRKIQSSRSVCRLVVLWGVLILSKGVSHGWQQRLWVCRMTLAAWLTSWNCRDPDSRRISARKTRILCSEDATPKIVSVTIRRRFLSYCTPGWFGDYQSWHWLFCVKVMRELEVLTADTAIFTRISNINQPVVNPNA